jgi:hypothetical protein
VIIHDWLLNKPLAVVRKASVIFQDHFDVPARDGSAAPLQEKVHGSIRLSTYRLEGAGHGEYETDLRSFHACRGG